MTEVFFFDGRPVPFRQGETAAQALLRAGVTDMGPAPSGQRRSVFCGIGQCQGCLVEEAKVGITEACLLLCWNGMELTSMDDKPDRHGDSHA